MLAMLLAGCWTTRPVVEPETPSSPRERAPAPTVMGHVEVLPDGALVLRELMPVEGAPLAAGIELDLVDCGGWIGRVRVIARKDVPWKIALVARAPPSTPACRTGETNLAFAVSPAGLVSDGPRATLDGRTIFETLPAAVQSWHRDHAAAAPVAWADVDGDGAADLVDIEGACKPSDPDLTCGAILRRGSGGWRAIARRTPM